MAGPPGLPGRPPSRSQPPSFGLPLPASGLAARNPAPPEPRLLLATVGCPSERRAPAVPHPGRYFPFRAGLGGEGGGEKGVKGEAAGKGGGGLAGASGGAGVPKLGPEGGRETALVQAVGGDGTAGGGRAGSPSQ